MAVGTAMAVVAPMTVAAPMAVVAADESNYCLLHMRIAGAAAAAAARAMSNDIQR